MQEYRFVGSFCEIGALPPLDHLGQRVALPDEVAALADCDGGPLVLQADVFDGLGFTEEELKAYPNPGLRSSAPESFQAKYREALRLIHERREAASEKRRLEAEAAKERE